jgi:hypothetical protein
MNRRGAEDAEGVASFGRGALRGAAKARKREGGREGEEISPRMGHGCTRRRNARGGDGAQRAEVVCLAWVGEGMEQEIHKKEVPGGSGGGPGAGSVKT